MWGESVYSAARWALGGLFGLGLILLTAPAAEAATFRVGQNCGGPDIQDCVDAAALTPERDLILVPRKTGAGKPNDAYYENVVVNTDVTIRGVANNRSTTCLDPRRAVDPGGQLRRRGAAVIVDAAPAGDPGGIGFTINGIGAEGTTVECIVVRHGTDGFLIITDDVTLNRVVALGQSEQGIEVNPGDGYVIRDSLIHGSNDDGIGATGNGATLIGNSIRNAGDICVNLLGDNLIVDDNRAVNCNGDGFEIDGAAPTVRRNRVEQVENRGFDIDCTGSCGDGRVERNVATDCDDDGFQVGASGGAPGAEYRVLNNQSLRNRGDGFDLEGQFLVVRNNLAERTGDGSDNEAGFYLDGLSDGTLTDNISRFNAHDGFQIDTGDRNTFERNQAIQNDKDGFDAEAGSDNVFRNNTATRNEAEGFENSATDTLYVGNTARRNRIDCANDGTLDAGSSGNTCADGSNFAGPPEVDVVNKADGPRREGNSRR